MLLLVLADVDVVAGVLSAHTLRYSYGLLILFQLVVGGGGAVLVLSELESMAARQQREIAQQRRLLEQREARLAVLRGAQVSLIIIIIISLAVPRPQFPCSCCSWGRRIR